MGLANILTTRAQITHFDGACPNYTFWRRVPKLHILTARAQITQNFHGKKCLCRKSQFIKTVFPIISVMFLAPLILVDWRPRQLPGFSSPEIGPACVIKFKTWVTWLYFGDDDDDDRHHYHQDSNQLNFRILNIIPEHVYLWNPVCSWQIFGSTVLIDSNPLWSLLQKHIKERPTALKQFICHGLYKYRLFLCHTTLCRKLCEIIIVWEEVGWL